MKKKYFDGLPIETPIKIVGAVRDNKIYQYAEYYIYEDIHLEYTFRMDRVSDYEYVKIEDLKQQINDGEVYYVCSDFNLWENTGILYIDENNNLYEVNKTKE